MSVEDYFKEYKVIRLTGYKDVKVDNFYTAGISAVGINSDSFILIWPGYCGKDALSRGPFSFISFKRKHKKSAYKLVYRINFEIGEKIVYRDETISAINFDDFIEKVEKVLDIKIIEPGDIFFEDEDDFIV